MNSWQYHDILETPNASGRKDVVLESGTGGYAVGWLTLALINSGLAQSKGRRGWVWWLLSLLLGPIATFLIVVLSAK